MSGRIMLIENDTDISEIITLNLNKKDFKVFPSDGEFLFKDIISTKPNLIIIDYFLKRKETGADLCNSIKTNSNFQHIPVILMSSLIDLEYTAKECKATSLIYKPFDMTDFINRVLTALSNSNDSVKS
jgi:two-component system OmpR family response regulator